MELNLTHYNGPIENILKSKENLDAEHLKYNVRQLKYISSMDMVIFIRKDEIYCYQLKFKKDRKFEGTELILKSKVVVNGAEINNLQSMQVVPENNVSVIVKTNSMLTYLYDISTGDMKVGWQIKTGAGTNQLIRSYKYYPSERLVLIRRETGSIYYVYPHFDAGTV